MAGFTHYTRNSGNFTGAAGLANSNERIATWQIVNKNGISVGPQRPGQKSLVVFIQSTVPAHIATGQITIVIENSQHLGGLPAYSADAGIVPTTLAAAFNQETAITYDSVVHGDMGDYLSIYFDSATASVDANCTYAMPVYEK